MSPADSPLHPTVPAAGLSAALDADALRNWLHHSPCAQALLHGSAGTVQWANPAFAAATAQELARLPGMSLDELFDLEPTQRLALLQTGLPLELAYLQGHGRVGHARLQCQPLQGELAVLTLWPTDEPARLRELLDMTQTFGRLGVWTREARSERGHWDQHVFRFWGLPLHAGTPDFSAAAAQIVAEDRPLVESTYRNSLLKAGSYACRYRVQRAGGGVTHLHSQWVVSNGLDGRPEQVIGVMMDDTETVEQVHRLGHTAEQLRLAVDLGNIIHWRFDLQHPRIELNDKSLEMLGLAAGTVLSPQQMLAYIHPDDVAEFNERGRQARSHGRPVDMEVRFKVPGNQWRHVLTRRVAQQGTDGRTVALLGVGLDVTERVHEASRIQRLAQRFEVASQAAGIGFVSIEHASPSPTWNAQMRRLHGYSHDEAEPTVRHWLDHHVHPADREHTLRTMKAMTSGQMGEFDIELRLLRRDGAVRHARWHAMTEGSGEHAVYVGVMIDETERRSAEAALRAAHERAALAARGAGLGTWQRDLRDGKLYWDEQMWRLRGLQPQAAAPDSHSRDATIHPEDRARINRLQTQAIADDEPSTYEFRCVLPTGEVRWLASRSVPLRDEAGTTIARLGVNWDITDSKMAETARQEKTVAERESLAKSQFLARMSHELRTPLNAVLGFTQMMQNDGERVTAETRKRRLEHIRSAGQHLLSLINDVLDLSSLEGGEIKVQLSSVNLANLVAETLPLVDRQARQKKVKLRSGLLEGTPQADATRLRQVLLNLLTNAIKYNHEGGMVTVESESRGPWVLLRITDTGRGMNDEQLRHVFEPFNRLGVEREGIEGTGIGLAIVKALVERMGGSVHVDSSPSSGSMFELRLPQAAGTPLPPSEHLAGRGEGALELPASQHEGLRGCVLYIEDNPVNVMIVEELVGRRPDLRLCSAQDGESGVTMARELLPDLVLVDMQLPDFDGMEVLRRLREDPATCSIPCISLSANALREDIDAALAAGFADYWTKPLDFAQFTAALGRLFGPAPGTLLS